MWTDLTWLLYRSGVSWGYYVFHQNQQLPPSAGVPSEDGTQSPNGATPDEWNPLPHFADVKSEGQLGNIQDIDDFFTQAAAGTLPEVAWVAPNYYYSEHSGYGIENGQYFVTSVINAVMRSPDWNSSAIFLVWSDWGGYYDHQSPPVVDANGYGIRVPGLVISPYARAGYIDPQILSFDAYPKFIEDLFLGGQRLDPSTDGRPDSRPDVRENLPILGDLMQDFDFTQAPRPPLILNPRP